MRVLLVLAALAVTLPGHAQNVQAPSDSYLCNHGDQTAAATVAACARLRGGAPAPVAPTSGSQNASPDAAARPAAPSSAPAAAGANDVGETPDESAADVTNGQDQDEDQAHISVHGSWLPFLGPVAIVAVILGGFVGMAFYFLPTIIALVRQKRNTIAILVLNFFLGWTFIGWVAALVWSLATEPGR